MAAETNSLNLLPIITFETVPESFYPSNFRYFSLLNTLSGCGNFCQEKSG